MPSQPSIPPNAVHYQLIRSQIVGQWFRLRMLQRQKFVIYGTMFLFGVVMISSRGPKAYLGWVCMAFPFLFALLFYGGLHRVVSQHPEMIGPRWFSFDGDGVVFAGANSRTEYAWSRIRKFTQTNDYYLLHLDSRGSAAAIPKAAFTPEQRERFLSFTQVLAG